MLELLVLAVVAWAVWRLVARAGTFAQGFARLLDGPRIVRGATGWLTGRTVVTGTFKGRPVTLRMEEKRWEYDVGFLVVAMQVDAPPGSPWKDSALTSRHSDASRALFDLEARQDLVLGRDDGWLTATWTPVGLVIFPGRFDSARWRRVLEGMHAVASWMENLRH